MRSKPQLTFCKLDSETGDTLDRMFEKKDCMVEINPGKVILPVDYVNIGQDILDMEVLPDDVWMCSYPRTGSTWCQEMVWLIGHDLDYEGAKSLQQIRCPLVELSHLPWDLLPLDIEKDDGKAKAKVIYTSRNPKDMVVSYYHYCTLVHELRGPFEEFCDLFMRDRAPFGPVWNHILGFWNRRNDPNVLFIKFEDMKRDLPSVVRRTATFLNKELTDDQVAKLCDHLSFKNMKNNRAVNLEAILERSFGKSYLEQTNLRFIRKGEIGDWKNYMSEDLSRRFDEWAEKNIQGTGLSFE
ncbi:hypothetical protein ACJJTC_014087 [Scirpophaga incertulas]